VEVVLIQYVHAEAKQFKAVIIRIDSGGGDALASDL
jgi:ClpP class serine protease